MASYSHSRIETFQQCRYKYKLQYIDRIKVDVPATVEAFMGDLVHRTLEKLYKERGLPVERYEIKGKTVFHKIFRALVIADWAGF